MIFIPIILAALYMGWSMGANDAANCIGADIGSGMMPLKVGIAITCVFCFLGAVFLGGNVIKTIGTGVVDINCLPLNERNLLALTSLFSAAVWGTIATYKKFPVSTSHSIVGAVAGGGLVLGTSLHLEKIIQIFICWILTPIGSCVFTVLFYYICRSFFRIPVIRRHHRAIMYVLIYITSAYLAFSWGANDVANATGILIGIQKVSSQQAAVIGALAIGIGVITWGYRVIETVGFKITHITPLMTIAIEIATALNVHLYTRFGIPVSTSHAIVGAVWGAGLVQGIKTVNLKLGRDIVVTWAVTPFISGIITYITLGILLTLTKGG
ncbi:MAG: inorganic phosphate transporter [Candidatus Ratteibacteria bacterium]|nr:inorganic phosphate transporter [Candidatus Ratteibacteria bacterium]